MTTMMTTKTDNPFENYHDWCHLLHPTVDHDLGVAVTAEQVPYRQSVLPAEWKCRTWLRSTGLTGGCHTGHDDHLVVEVEPQRGREHNGEFLSRHDRPKRSAAREVMPEMEARMSSSSSSPGSE